MDVYFMFGAGVPAPGGFSGAGGGVPVPIGMELSAGVVPLSVVVLPLVDAPDGSIGGGVLEPPQATADEQATNKSAKVEVRFIAWSFS
jgi:hypothetical protein